MELSWRYAWANFFTLSILSHSFPFPEAIISFTVAFVLTLFSKGKGWRVITILSIQVFGFLLVALRMVYVFNTPSSPFLSQSWPIEYFTTSRSPLEWFNFILLLLLTLMFWTGGVTLARKAIAYSKICSRFDLGVAAFFLLFITQFILLIQGGFKVEDPISPLLIFPFFIFSLLAIGLVRNQTAASRDFLPGYQGIGVILSFTVAVFLFGTGLILFFLPYLTLAAETGYTLLKTAAKPLAPVLVSILRFLFMSGAIRPENPSPSGKEPTGDLISSAESSWWMELIEKILGWVFGGLLGLFVLIITVVALFFLFRWLLSRAPVSQKRQTTSHLISWWMERLRIFLVSFWKWIIRKIKGYKGAVQLYMALQKWGSHSGLPPLLSETPIEYGLRLKSRFPSLKGEIGLIIEAFNQEVYVETTLSERQWVEAKSAWGRLCSPLHWPSRFKNWLPQPTCLSA
jgi:hypothetical protein